jgi:hypothetical protein
MVKETGEMTQEQFEKAITIAMAKGWEVRQHPAGAILVRCDDQWSFGLSESERLAWERLWQESFVLVSPDR